MLTRTGADAWMKFTQANGLICPRDRRQVAGNALLLPVSKYRKGDRLFIVSTESQVVSVQNRNRV